MNLRAVALALAITAAASRAHADPKADAAEHVEAAQTAHAAGDYAKALDELTAAYELDPQPELLFALGQVLGKLDRCRDAIGYYKRFLATQKERDARAITQQAIDACKATLKKHPQPHTTTDRDPEPDEHDTATPPPSPPPPPPPPPGAGAEQPAFYTDVLGDALVGGGVAFGVASVIAYTSARSQLDAAGTATTLADYQTHVDGAHTRRLAAVICAIGSGALLTTGILHFALRPTIGFAPTPSGDGGIVSWQGRW